MISPSRSPSDLRYTRIEAVALALVVLAATSFVVSGTPVLRQDWPPPLSSIDQSLSILGWDPIGLGSAVGYPSSFMIVFARAILGQLVGPYLTHVAYMAASWLLVASGARSLSSRCGAPMSARLAAMLVATFNPWTYTELVAGHLYILLAYGATLWLASEAMRAPAPRTRALLAILLLFATQIQFLVLDGIALAIVGIRSRDVRTLALLGSFVLFVGWTIVLTRSSLETIPFKLTWEAGLSLAPIDATFLRGYFTHYSVGGDGIAAVAIGVTLVLAAIGLFFSRLTPPKAAIAAVTFCAVTFATGTKGPVALPFDWLVQHVVEIALFRELYTLLGFAALGYVALASYGTKRFPILGIVWLLAAFAGPASWIGAPPSTWWARAEDVPHVPVPADRRYALLPALQPMSLGSKGAGIDPDVRAGPGSSAPIDGYRLSYPADAAFGYLLRDRDTAPLAALSVSEIIARPWLSSQNVTNGALAFPVPAWLKRPNIVSRITTLSPLPMLALSPLPKIGTAIVHVGRGNVQVGDAGPLCADVREAGCDASAPRPVNAPNVYVEAKDGWVDARLAFLVEPELAQNYGGAITTNSAALLPLIGGEDALVSVAGRLTNANGTRALDRGGTTYHWIAIPQDTDAVRCFGRCVVAAQMNAARSLPLEPPAQSAQPVDFQTLLPWLVVAHVGAGNIATLRYDVTYDRHWSAYLDRAVLPHIRIDGVVNGWIVPGRSSAGTVVIVEWGAAITTILELAVTLGAMAAFAWRPRVQ